MKIFPIQTFINYDSEFFKILKSLPPVGGDGPWVAGGSVWKAIENKQLTCDIDFFFQSAKQCEQWYRTILSIPYSHRIVSESNTNNYNTSFKYCVPFGSKNKPFTLQLISFKFFNSMEHLLDSFDFTACQFGFDGKNLYTGNTSLEDLRNREIIFHNINSLSATLNHLRKYTDVGFKVSEPQMKILEDMRIKNNIIHSSPIPSTDDPILTNPCVIPSLTGDGGYPEPVRGSDGIDLSTITQSNPSRPVSN